MAEPIQIKISHPDVEKPGFVVEESLEGWLELGWSVVEPEPPGKPVTQFVARIEGEATTMVEAETLLPDEKESVEDETAEES